MGRYYERGLLSYCRLQYVYCYSNHFTATMITRHYFKCFSFKVVFWLVKVSVNYTDPQYYGNVQ